MIRHILACIQSIWSPSTLAVPHSTNELPATLSEPVNLKDGWSWIPDWEEIFNGQYGEWLDELAASAQGKKILVATCVGGNSALTPIESLLAVALTLRGACVHVLLCDKAIPACTNVLAADFGDQKDFLAKGPTRCDWCYEAGARTYRKLRLPVHLLSDYIAESDRLEAAQLAANVSLEDAPHYTDRDIPIGEHARAGALRYFARGDFDNEPYALEVVRRYLEAGIMCSRALDRLYDEHKYAATVVNHGIYVPQGLVTAIAKKYKSSTALWYPQYRNKCVGVYNVKDDIETVLLTANNESWETMPWTKETEDEIVGYLQSRWKGTYDWIKAQAEDGPTALDEISRETGIDYSKPTIGLLTNVTWDAQVFYPSNALPTMLEWMITTIRYFETRPDLQLIIRVHPGELTGFVISRQLAVDEIKRAFPKLPPNVFVIPPDSPINTYAAMKPCKAILIYATTAGLEFASMGFPVVVAGEAVIRNKGFSYDVSSEDEYLKLLDKLPFAEDRINPNKMQRARKFAYHSFFRKMIPLDMLQPQESVYVPYTIKHIGVDGFRPGKDPGLDVICDGILNKTEFVYPYEKYQLAGVGADTLENTSLYSHKPATRQSIT